jgi:hypothetical protein
VLLHPISEKAPKARLAEHARRINGFIGFSNMKDDLRLVRTVDEGAKLRPRKSQ